MNPSTIRELLLRSVEATPDAVAIRHKQGGAWRVIRYRELWQRARCVSEVLHQLGAGRSAHVAIFLENDYRWPELYLGVATAAFIAVPVDAKLREQEVAHILRDAAVSVVFASPQTYGLIREIADSLPTLKHVVVLDGATLISAERTRIAYHDFATLSDQHAAAANGAVSYSEQALPEPDDLASIIYTSGTTGRPKGAMLTHANFCGNVNILLDVIDVRSDDNFLLVLPLHHVFAFTGNLLMPLGAGAEISMVESLRTIGENVREVSPTVLIGVPLLLQKMYNRIQARLRQRRSAAILLALGLRKPIRKSILRNLGGKLRIAIVGGAPSDPDMIRGFAKLGIPVIEGYGLTETAPVLTMNPVTAPRPGSIGKPLPNIQLRIDTPNADGVGEIAARGPSIMRGYFNHPDATELVLHDGWFFTGDMGYIDAEGYVFITGRRKNLIVNREGKNIAPEAVEQAVLKSPAILECLVLGYCQSRETGERVGAMVVPDQACIDAEARRRGHPLSDAEIEQRIRTAVKKATQPLADFQRPRYIQIRTEPFERTSTQKIKRYLYAIIPTEV